MDGIQKVPSISNLFMPKKYKAIFSLKEVGQSDDFLDAFTMLARRIQNEPHMTIQLLETGCWIEIDGCNAPLMFYTARDQACEQGWTIDRLKKE